MADDGFEYECRASTPEGVWLNRQTLDGLTPSPKPGDRLLFAEAVFGVDWLEPYNDAAKTAAELFAEADDGGPLAGRVGSMKVADVLPLLDVLDPVELQAVRDAEAADRASVKILNRIDELLSPAVPAGEEEVV